METPTLVGQRVRLEGLRSEHRAGLEAAAAEQRDSYAFTLVPADTAGWDTWFAQALADRDNGDAVPFVVIDTADDRVVGTTRFFDFAYFDVPLVWPPGGPHSIKGDIPSAAEIGSTWLAQSAQRTGINVEMKYLMLSYAFEVWHCERITLKTDVRNMASRQAILGIGAKFEGVRRAHWRTVDGTIRDSAYFSIIAAEWPEVKQMLEQRLARSSR